MSGRPNFFLVGAPKCGTTAMVHYLAGHPEVFFSAAKEPHYFASDIRDADVRNYPALEDYLGLFEGAEEPIVGEASVFYLYSEAAIPALLEFEPEARIMVMVRNPIELVHSLHSQLLFSGQESEADFRVAWGLQDSRSDNPLLQYEALGHLGAQYRRLRSLVSSGRLMTVVFDDFRSDPAREYARALDFLSLKDDGRSRFEVVNANRRHRSRALKRVIEALPDPTPVKRMLGIERIGLGSRLQRLNLKRFSRGPLAADFRAELVESFRDDVLDLGDQLGRDLSHWLGSG